MEYTLPNGHVVLNLNSEKKETLEILVENEGQADEFVCDFLMDCENENIAVTDYRLHRVEERCMSCKEFLKLYSISIVIALRELFLQPVKKLHVNLLTQQLKSGKLTIEQLFKRFTQEPNANLLRLLL